MNFLKFAFFFAFSLLFQGATFAQEWTSYQSQQQVNDLVDTGEELLLATDAGLVVMNKTTLEKTIFNKANSNLSNNHIQSITTAPSGETFIGVYDAIVARFDGSDFVDTIKPESEHYDRYTELYDFKIAPNGDFWLGTSDGIFHKHGQAWSHYGKDELGPNFFECWDIEINSDGDVFIASHNVYKFADGEWSNLSDTTQLFGYLDADLFFSKSGDLYVAGDLDRLGRFDGVQWQEYEDIDVELNGSHIIGFTEDTNGSMYFFTLYDGIFQLIGDTWTQQMDAQTTAFDNNIAYYYIDEQNNRWMNSNIQLSVNKNGLIQSTSIAPHTLATNNVNKIRKGENGHVYFMSTFDNNISVVDPDGLWSFLPLPASLMPFEYFNDVLFLADNDIWLASNEGLYHYNGNEWAFTSLGNSGGFAVDTKGKIYLRTTSKIYILEDGMTSEYNVDNSPITAFIISGHGVDANDNLWISSFTWDGDNAIQKVSTDGTWTTYSGTDHPVINQPRGDFYFDQDGQVWVPSGLIGAIKFDGNTWTNPVLDHKDEISNAEVHSIAGDATGKLYFSHQFGLSTLQDDQWEDLLIEDVPNEFSSFSSDIEFDNVGRLWWGSTRHGVFSYTPANTTAILSDFEQSTDFTLYPNPTIDYVTLDFTLPATARVKVQLYNNLGQLQSSVALGQLHRGIAQQRIVNLSHLPKGIYLLQLQIDDQSFTKAIIRK